MLHNNNEPYDNYAEQIFTNDTSEDGISEHKRQVKRALFSVCFSIYC